MLKTYNLIIISMELEIIQKKLEIKYYKSILSGINESNTNYLWLQSYCDKLIDKLNSDKEKLSETQTEKKNEVSLPIETENHKQIFSDENLYKKSWVKLNPVHKILKIKEFVNNLKINSEKERAQFRDELIDLVKLKVLTKKEKVNYDEINGKIISLSDLQYKNEKYFYPKE
jgi:hypothetical protein